MKHYIFTTRNGIHIIDLQKTRMKLENAYYAMKELAAEGKKVLFVGTKKQAQSAIEREASKCGMFFIAYRWPGGLLTNFDTVKRSITRLKDIESMQEKGVYNVETKKERLELERESQKLNKVLKGIKDMHKLPDALFVIDPKRETIAINEAKKLRIPIFAVVDSNCDPEDIDYPIPGNDDAIRAIVLFLEVISKAVISGVTGQDLELEEGESDNDAEMSDRGPASRTVKSSEDDLDNFESDEMDSSGMPAGIKASENDASFKEEKKSPDHNDEINEPEKSESA